VYDAWGAVVSSTGTFQGRFGHGGAFGYQSDSTGLQLLGHRYYDPAVGRFLTPDPIKDGRNWFAYCENNPLNATDPTGLTDFGDIWPTRLVNDSGIPVTVLWDENIDGKRRQYVGTIPSGRQSNQQDLDYVLLYRDTDGNEYWYALVQGVTYRVIGTIMGIPIIVPANEAEERRERRNGFLESIFHPGKLRYPPKGPAPGFPEPQPYLGGDLIKPRPWQPNPDVFGPVR